VVRVEEEAAVAVTAVEAVEAREAAETAVERAGAVRAAEPGAAPAARDR